MSKTAKTIIFDIANNIGGYPTWSILGIRSIEFKLDGSLIPVAPEDITAYSTTQYASGQNAYQAFNTSLSKIGSWTLQWMAAYGSTTNQRLLCIFDTPIEFDEIVVNNYHASGTTTLNGAKTIKVSRTDDTVSDTTYNAAISGGETLFEGDLSAHVSSDVVDDQVIYEPSAIPIYDVVIDYSLSMSSGIEFNFPALINFGVTVTCGVTIGPVYAVAIPMEMSPTLSFSIGFSVAVSASLAYNSPFGISFPMAGSINMSYVEHFMLSFNPTTELSLNGRFNHGDFSIIATPPEEMYAGTIFKRYRCMLGSLEIPVSSFQIRSKNGTPSYLEVATPRFDMLDNITDNSGDDLSVHIDYILDGEAVKTIELAEVSFDLSPIYDGPSSKSLVLSGHKTVWHRAVISAALGTDYVLGEGAIATSGPGAGGASSPPPNSVTIPDSNLIMIRESGGKTSLSLVEADYNLKVGDIAYCRDSSFLVDAMTYVVGDNVLSVTVSE